jgi:hypothetical protein
MVRWLSAEEAKAAIVAIGGYDTEHTGEVEWVG